MQVVVHFLKGVRVIVQVEVPHVRSLLGVNFGVPA